MTADEWREGAAELRAKRPRHILFLCRANSARSQLAEGIARSMAPEGVRISSAGAFAYRVDPLAIRALAEAGIDASGQTSKAVDDIDTSDVDAVITLCAEQVCPVFLGRALRLHWVFDDPTSAGADDESRLRAFREVRDEIRRRLEFAFEGWSGTTAKR